MARAIDAEQYMELLKEQYLHNKFMNHGEAAKAWQGAMQLLHDMPSLTPPNEIAAGDGFLTTRLVNSLIILIVHCLSCGARMDKENEAGILKNP